MKRLLWLCVPFALGALALSPGEAPYDQRVRAFLAKYADRALYGTDLGIIPGQDAEATARRMAAEYARDWTYFATDRTIEHVGRKVQGLGLPAPVLRRIFRENALRWVSGLEAAEAGR